MVRFLLLIVLINSVLLSSSATNLEIPIRQDPVYEYPTRRFLEYYNYEAVLQTLRAYGLSLEHRNFFEHIIPHEELGFFGYHSSTQGFRIYQDIIRMVLEEIYNGPRK